MDEQRRVLCPDNQELVNYMMQKKQDLSENPKGLSEKLEMTLYKAYKNICDTKDPIWSLRDLSQIKGVGKWMLKLMQGYFDTVSGNSEKEDLPEKCIGKKTKTTKRYIPQRNSVAYALLIALHRGTVNGKEFMCKQELIDAAEASGLSRAPIVPEKAKGRLAQFGSSSREWYTGWTCMKTLITKGLVVKSSCPAKYMLTEEGREVAIECLMRSGLPDSAEISDNEEMGPEQHVNNSSYQDLYPSDISTGGRLTSTGLRTTKKSIDIPAEVFEKFTRMGYSKEQVITAFIEVSDASQDEDASSLWLTVMCHLREAEVYNSRSDPQPSKGDFEVNSKAHACSRGAQVDLVGTQTEQLGSACNDGHMLTSCSAGSTHALRACSSFFSCTKSASNGLEGIKDTLSMPPLSFGERFEDAYEVILILDDREQFATMGSRSRRIIDNICSEFKIKIQVRRLPVGDGVWIARHKYLETEYVLDFIVERKKVEDLRSSISDNRYKDQKLRLLRSGLKKLIYVVEGDPNTSDAAESIKTACFTTEILEGFDVQRTSGLADTLRKYGFLTQAIYQSYKSRVTDDQTKTTGVCPPFVEFVKRCQDLDKMTVNDVFSVQLMQVPQVTEDVVLAVLNVYPTLLSLASAYSHLEGNVQAQQEMLRKQSNNLVSATASKNIFRLVWGD